MKAPANPREGVVIHLVNACSATDYKQNIAVESYTYCQKSKGNSIIIRHKNKKITIPLSNIAAIEENDD